MRIYTYTVPKMISLGGDLNWLRQRHDCSPTANVSTMITFYNLFLCVRHIGVPTIAAINGAAIGAGLCMTLACDVRVAHSKAKLGFTFPKVFRGAMIAS